MTAPALDRLNNFPFRRLNDLLSDLTPGADPILMQIGEPQNAVPALVAETVAQNAELFGKYPPNPGSDAYREAVADWLVRRFGLPAGGVDPQTQTAALCGTREGLFQAALTAVMRKRDRMIRSADLPAVLMPNPMYHVYFGGAVAAGAEAVPVDALPENGFLPDYAALPEDLLARTAICYLCNPGNPTGAVADRAEIERMLTLARQHDFVLALDECYSEIWFDAPPTGGLEAAAGLPADRPWQNLLVFNSLSKRSGAPGLRCGFAAGDPDLIGPLVMLRSYGGAQVPGPLMAAGTALWRDEGHVETNRAHYAALLALAARHLDGIPGFRAPEAGFFLWLDTRPTLGDGETAARVLWREAGLKALPGRYMAQPDSADGTTPGDGFLRLALVHDAETVEVAMRRLASVLHKA
jgi:aspartate/methionine/tyrosine aminotransferase